MSKLLSLLALTVTFTFGIPASSAAQPLPDAAGGVVEVTVPAPALTGNLLGTADEQKVAIYLPPGYDGDINDRYPVIYLLHGIFDDYDVWIKIEDVPARLDRLIAAGSFPKALVVMPNAGNIYGGGYYRNSPISGRWADYITDDLVSHIDAAYRTLPRVDSRAVVGHSMGGFGALHLAISKPGVFSVVWAMSPCCLAATDDFGFGNDAWKRAAAVETQEDIDSLQANQDFFAIAALGIISAFSTEVAAPPVYADFPFDVVRGEVVLDSPAYDRYLDFLPIRQIGVARENLRGLRGLGLGVGLNDQFRHIPPGTLAFSQHLGSMRIPHVLEVYDGDHRQKIGERLENVVLPWIGARIMLED